MRFAKKGRQANNLRSFLAEWRGGGGISGSATQFLRIGRAEAGLVALRHNFCGLAGRGAESVVLRHNFCGLAGLRRNQWLCDTISADWRG